VMTTQGQGRAADPVGLGIPVVIQGSWASPQIYPEMAGMLDNPDGAYAKLKQMGKGLFGSGGALGGLGGNLLGGNTPGGNTQGGNAPAASPLGGLFGGNGSNGNGGSNPLGGGLGQSIGSMIQGLGQNRQGNGQGQTRAIPAPDSATNAAPPTTPPLPDLPAQGDATAQGSQESQPMNDMLKQLFNR
jgi:AsmA protein